MKNSFKQFLADTNRRHSFQRKLISLLCVLSILVSTGVSMLLTMPGLTASSDPVVGKGIKLVTDNPTHNRWIEYFGISSDGSSASYDTEFVGSVWTDKSVFQTYTTSKNQTISAGTGNMLGVLSAIGSSLAITGRIYTPTDVMLILDLSSSMYVSGSSRNPETVRKMVSAVNASIDTLLSLNDYNRVGVTVYYGGSSVLEDEQSTSSYGYVLLPLDRYTAANSTNPYLTAHTSSSGKLESVKVTSGVKNSQGTLMPTTGHNTPDVAAGTYTQLGILHAMDQFLAADDLTVSIDELGVTVNRQPIFVLMSDGEPTAATTDFSNKADAQFGNNQVASRSPDATDFVTQLTAAYARAEVEKYYPEEPLFYTLGLKMQSMSLNVMDPSNNSTDTINSYWNSLVQDDEVSVKAQLYKSDWSDYKTNGAGGQYYDFTVSLATMKDGTAFPTSTSQRLYVDRYFNADTDDALFGAFEDIVDEIILKSIYTPTHSVPNRENNSGEVSFVDQVGQYMEVKKINGVLMGGVLHTGATFAKTLVQESEKLGTLGNATAYGMAFWNNVMEQIGLDDVFQTVGPGGEEFGETVPAVAATRDLITAAYDAKQLSYTSDTEFSNYIGWYANANDVFCGFWNGKDETQTPKGATQRIKTYFFQGTVDGLENMTMDSDMMYITVWVKEEIATGIQTVIFSVPASLLPTLKYFVKLDENGNLVSVHMGSVDSDPVFDDDGNILIRPVRLVYEVGLQSDINAQTLLDKVDADYLANNTNEDGEVYFYSNEWERDTDGDGVVSDVGYGYDNTYSYFRPSTFNGRYYYLEDCYIYTKAEDGSYVKYSGDKPVAAQDLYTLHPLYSREGDKISVGEYPMPLGDIATESAVADSGYWYIPAGTAHILTIKEGNNRFARLKEAMGNVDANATETLIYRNIPTQDDTGTVGEFVLASTLGNNGRIAVAPSGQTLIKKLVDEDGAEFFATRDESFYFLLHEGTPLKDSEGETINYNDGAAVLAALDTKKITLLKLDVDEGESSSNRQMLYNLTEYTWRDGAWHQKSDETPLWDCTYLEHYTLVELTPDARYDPVGIAKEPYTFQYGVYPEGETDHTIYASNKFNPWSVNLTKIDSEQTNNKLPGAVFGLYSPVQDDGLEELPAEYADVLSTVSYDGQTWYLAQIQVTDENGTLEFEYLMWENYLVRELQPPPGYLKPTDDIIQTKVSRTETDTLVLAISISNTPGMELPSTGGFGTRPYIIVGAALMISAAVLMLVYEISKRKEEGVSS